MTTYLATPSWIVPPTPWEAQARRSRDVGWQAGTATSDIAEEKHEGVPGTRGELIGRAQQMIATQSDEHQVKHLGV